MCSGCNVLHKLQNEENFINRNFILIKSTATLCALASDENGFKEVNIDVVKPISDSCSYLYKIYYIITNMSTINYQIF